MSALLQEMADDFRLFSKKNDRNLSLGSLIVEAFDEKCSDVDCIVIMRREINERRA
jgi:hypothetical protein